ncbi:MAG: hypothetical protein H7070_13610 [Saprospiraceae bacterium]|nr:hypothetical protein [Pyrinomonadaceae bacterium]
MQNILDLDRNLITEAALNLPEDRHIKKIGLMGKLFGCRHKQLTRPFSDRNSSYRACLDCGARKKFDTQSFKTSGAFYFPQSVTFDRNGTNL